MGIVSQKRARCNFACQYGRRRIRPSNFLRSVRLRVSFAAERLVIISIT